LMGKSSTTPTSILPIPVSSMGVSMDEYLMII
jgi:hypothetical protein